MPHHSWDSTSSVSSYGSSNGSSSPKPKPVVHKPNNGKGKDQKPPGPQSQIKWQ
ncbi:hypothetical protein FQN57_005294 [Myotisia sp. PD_48]|nr:hypothetical protein FQN57_005294 [Myotisia sp. PD_48]